MADNNENYEVSAVKPEDLPPPPSYEDVIGQYVTTVQRGTTMLPSLAYIDIMPRLLDPGNIKEKIEPQFQSFDELVEGANVWLRDNPTMSVWKCETVERKVSSGNGPKTVSIDLDSVTQHEATFGFNCFVFGLRLWLTPTADGQKGVQQLGLMNVLPQEEEVNVTVHYGGRGFMRSSYGLVGISKNQILTTYKGLKTSLNTFNEKLKESGIPGTILNVESTTLKFAEGRKQTTLKEAASSSIWYELNGQSSKRYTQILRIYYIKGNTTKPEIKMQQFLPTQLNRPDSAFKPVKFDTFSSVINKAAAWIKEQSGIQISNIETRAAELNRYFNEIQIETDSSDYCDFGLTTAGKLRFIRIFYTTNSSTPSYSSTCLTSRLFIPVSLGGGKFESMTQTMTRIDAWMRATGLRIFDVETLSLLRENLSERGVERCDLSFKPFTAKHWVNTIRVYFPHEFTEPDPNPFPSTAVAASNESSSCSIL